MNLTITCETLYRTIRANPYMMKVILYQILLTTHKVKYSLVIDGKDVARMYETFGIDSFAGGFLIFLIALPARFSDTASLHPLVSHVPTSMIVGPFTKSSPCSPTPTSTRLP